MKKLQQSLNSKGMAILTVILVFFILCVLLAGLLTFANANQNNAQIGNKHTTVFYTAESGLNLDIEKFDNLVNTAQSLGYTQAQIDTAIAALVAEMNTSPNNLLNLGTSRGMTNQAVLSVTAQPDMIIDGKTYKVYRITSVGTIDGVSRTLTQDFAYFVLNGQPTLGAVVTEGGIRFWNGTIEGPIGSNMIGGEIVFRDGLNCSLVASINVPVGTNLNLIPDCSAYDIPTNEISTIHFPTNYIPATPTPLLSVTGIVNNTLNLSTNLHNQIGGVLYNGFEITNFNPNPVDGELIINLGNWAGSTEFVTLNVTNDFFLPKKITIQGSGRLRIIARFKETLNLPTGFTLSPDDPMKFTVVLKNEDKVTYDKKGKPIYTPQSINFNDTFTGSLITDSKAPIDIKQSQYYGYLITDATSINIMAQVTVGSEDRPFVIYAPNAEYDMQAGTVIWGSIMVEDFYQQSMNSAVRYSGKLFNPDIPPFWLDLPTVPAASQIFKIYLPIVEQ